MTKKRTTLVLGAGASYGYGFPVGSGLRTDLIGLNNDSDAPEILGFSKADIRNFTAEFSKSQAVSIDAFLGRRAEFREVGKSAIAYLLLKCERTATIFNDESKDHWYQYLLHELNNESWEKLNFNWLSIVTFNYDRSLETYLTYALSSTYAKRRDEVADKLKTLKVIHVYGLLGDPWEGKEHIPFGIEEGFMERAVGAAASQLIIIPEGRQDSPTVIAAKQVIKISERICFLGFGFDETNILRLGAPHSFLNASGHPKEIVGTAFGLTLKEAERAAFRLTDRKGQNPFINCGCLKLLRETLILD